jgi:hypothetical protein
LFFVLVSSVIFFFLQGKRAFVLIDFLIAPEKGQGFAACVLFGLVTSKQSARGERMREKKREKDCHRSLGQNKHPICVLYFFVAVILSALFGSALVSSGTPSIITF